MRCGPSVMWAVPQRATTSAMPPIQLAHQSPRHISTWKVHHLTLTSFTLKTYIETMLKLPLYWYLYSVNVILYIVVFSCHNLFLNQTIAICTGNTFNLNIDMTWLWNWTLLWFCCTMPIEELAFSYAEDEYSAWKCFLLCARKCWMFWWNTCVLMPSIIQIWYYSYYLYFHIHYPLSILILYSVRYCV